jgi:hypothetical protein
MPIACLALAALVAFALPRARGALVAAAAVLVVVVDLRVPVYAAVAGDDGNRAYAALHGAAPGRLLELPVFRPERHWGSSYLYYAMQAPRERPGGYSTVAPRAADRLARRLRPLSCGRGARAPRLLRRLGVRYVALHRGLYAQSGFFAAGCADRAGDALVRWGLRPLARDGQIDLFALPAE